MTKPGTRLSQLRL